MNKLVSSQFGFILAASCLTLAGCSSVKTVEVPVVHTEYRTDTLRTHDSVHVENRFETFYRGDTIINKEYTNEYHYHNVYVNKTDSVHDTIPVTVEVVKEVPAQLTDHQKSLMAIGTVTCCLPLLIIIIYLISLWKRK